MKCESETQDVVKKLYLSAPHVPLNFGKFLLPLSLAVFIYIIDNNPTDRIVEEAK